MLEKGTADDQKVVKKAYICLSSCTASRTIHLEAVIDMRTETFLNYLRRSVARRGIPKLIVIDNPKTFKRANKLLIMLLRRPEAEAHLANQRITWKFNLELFQRWDRFFKRCVGLVKRSLKQI